MKPIKIILLIVALVCLAASCKKEPVTSRFAEEDKLKLLPHYIEGKIFTFVNENGEERKFQVEKIEQKIAAQHWIYGFCGGNCHDAFYCEPKYIDLIDLGTRNTFYLTFARFPIDFTKAQQDNYHMQPSSLLGQFRRSTTSFSYYFAIHFNLDETVQTFNFNGIAYNNVIVTHNNEAENSDGGMLIDAKTVYYDIYQGLIGFDDIHDHEWRLKNSK
jgi:hypothetical protein